MNTAMNAEVTPQRAERLLDDLCEIVARASAAILAIPLSQAEQRIKHDQSPVTKADEVSEAIILGGLAKLMPGLPVISEESVGHVSTPVELSCAIVDPLDGTREFLAGRDEYTVNIALVTRGLAIAGVIAAPRQGLLWRGVIGDKAERMRVDFSAGSSRTQQITIRSRAAPAALVAATSRTHFDAKSDQFLSRLNIARRYGCGSSVKFCHLAQGDSDVYPRLAPTSEWDVAAGCAILTAAGGIVTDPQGGELRFAVGAEGFRVPGFVAWGDPASARGA